MAEDAVPTEAPPEYGLEELAELSGVPARTIRYYQSQHLLPTPAKRGRDAVYRLEHAQRLRLIGELQERGLTLSAIRQLVATDRPTRTVAEWLGVDATLTIPWSDDRPRIVTRDELDALLGPKRRALVGALVEARYVTESTGGTWLVPSPALLDLALQLHDAGIDVEISGQLRDLMRKRLAKAVDDSVALLVGRAGAGFAGDASAEELTKALGVLRPVARETASLILAQEVERALRQLLERGPGLGRSRGRR